jgi:K+-transporting ATPase ATPase C chain
MVVNDNECFLTVRGALNCIASKLAPTGFFL